MQPTRVPVGTGEGIGLEKSLAVAVAVLVALGEALGRDTNMTLAIKPSSSTLASLSKAKVRLLLVVVQEVRLLPPYSEARTG